MRELPPVQFLRECYDYEPDTGLLRWKKRPVEHFSDAPHAQGFNRQFAGRRAGSYKDNGYLETRACFQGKPRLMLVHRVAWVLMTGEWPKGDIDHRNGIKDDNRWSNLRDVTRSVNGQNRHSATRGSKHGVLGVSLCTETGRWRARIKVDGAMRCLGRHDTPELAHAAYLQAKRQLHPGNTL